MATWSFMPGCMPSGTRIRTRRPSGASKSRGMPGATPSGIVIPKCRRGASACMGGKLAAATVAAGTGSKGGCTPDAAIAAAAIAAAVAALAG